MKAIVTRLMADKKREKVLVDNWKDPEGPTGRQIKTRTLFSGITNGTERNDLVRGNYATPDERLPSGWGYQNVGKIIETGPDCKELKVGDVVFMSDDHKEYCVIAEDGLLVKLPPEVDPKHAALFGMASVAMHTCRNAQLRMGDTFLVVGGGFIGQIAAQIATVMGARVTLVDVDERRMKMAREIGAAETVLNVSGDGWEKNISTFDLADPWSSAGPFDAVLDVAGVPGMENKLISAAKLRGTVLFIAGRGEVKYNFNLGQGREITIKQNGHFDRDDLANLCRLVARGMFKIGPMIQDVVPPKQAKHIYDTLRDEPNKLFGTVFDWQS
jgi:2-desacetyl-2-hydroxyethyl bacteriochlorophyllide A dehydrogenase